MTGPDSLTQPTACPQGVRQGGGTLAEACTGTAAYHRLPARDKSPQHETIETAGREDPAGATYGAGDGVLL